MKRQPEAETVAGDAGVGAGNVDCSSEGEVVPVAGGAGVAEAEADAAPPVSGRQMAAVWED